MTPSLDQFVRGVSGSGLVPEAEVAEIVGLLSRGGTAPTAQALAAELIFRRKLTKLQVEAIWLGRPDSLVLGQYALVDKIGEGGMGQVFRARHQTMKRDVAIKVLPATALKGNTAVARFQREVEAVARLSHPNIVTAHDAGRHQSIHYLVLEYVPGKNLAEVVRERGPLAWTQAVDIVVQAATGLEYAHARGVIHRDVKPANLLVTEQGQVKVADLGLARIALQESTETEELTNAGMVMGTADYMAPEQAVDTHTADARSDIYSLGATLYFALTGRTMYRGQNPMERLLAHREQPIPPLSEPGGAGGISTSVAPPALEAVYRRMVAKSPGDRFASMAAVIAALSTLRATPASGAAPVVPSRRAGEAVDRGGDTSPSLNADTLPQLPRPPSFPVESLAATSVLRPKPRRHPAGVWIGAGLGLLALLVAMTVYFAQPTSGRTTARRSSSTSSRKIPAEKPSGAPAIATLELDPAQIPPEERFEWQPKELDAVIGTHARTHWALLSSAAFSPDGRFLATTGHDLLLCVWRCPELDKVYETRLLSLLDGVREEYGSAVTWGPKPDVLWVATQDGVARRYRWDSGTLTLDRSWIAGKQNTPVSLQVTRDERRAVTCTGEGDLKLWDLDHTPPKPVFQQNLMFTVAQCALSADGRYLAAGDWDGRLVLWDLNVKEQDGVPWRPREVSLPETYQNMVGIAFDSTSRRFFVGHEYVADEFEITETGLQKVAGGFRSGRVELSPSDRWLCGYSDAGTYLLDRRQPGWTETPIALRHSAAWTSVARFSPDESTLLLGDLTGQMWQYDLRVSPPVLIKPPAPGSRAIALEFSPDGKWLALGTHDSGVTLWKAEGGKFVQKRVLPGGPDSRSPQWTADSRFLAFCLRAQKAATILDFETGQVLDLPSDQVSEAVALSLDGKRLAVSESSKTVTVWERRDARAPFVRKTRMSYDGSHPNLLFSPDGEQLALLIIAYPAPGLRVWDLRQDPPLEKTAEGNSLGALLGQPLAWSPDGTRLAATSNGTGLTVWDMTGATPRVEQSVHASQYLRYSPNGKRLLSAEGRQLVIRDVLGLYPLHSWTLHAGLSDVAWHPSGDYVAACTTNGTVYVLRVPESAR